MKSACRKTWASNWTPGRPGCRSLIALSMPFVTFRVFAPRRLLHDEQEAGAAADDRVADRAAAWPSLTFATSPMRTGWPLPRSIGTFARSFSLLERQHGPDAEPLVRGVDPPAGADRVPEVRVPQQARVERLRGRVHDLVERHVPGRHPRRVHVHVLLLEALAPDRDVHDAGHAQEARPDLPVGDRRQLLGATSRSR